METLFEGIQKEKLDQWKFEASIHGIDLEQGGSSSEPKQSQSDPSTPLFGDPESYQSLSNEERETQTNKMMSRHKAWAGESFKKG